MSSEEYDLISSLQDRLAHAIRMYEATLEVAESQRISVELAREGLALAKKGQRVSFTKENEE